MRKCYQGLFEELRTIVRRYDDADLGSQIAPRDVRLELSSQGDLIALRDLQYARGAARTPRSSARVKVRGKARELPLKPRQRSGR